MPLDNVLHSRVNPNLGGQALCVKQETGRNHGMLQGLPYCIRAASGINSGLLHTHLPTLRSQQHGFRETSKHEMPLHSSSGPLHPI